MLGGNPEMLIADQLGDDADTASPEARGQGRERDYRAERKRRWPPAGSIVLGTERHESRRIDNQLRGRSGRQGDPRPPPSSSSRSKDDLHAHFRRQDRMDMIVRSRKSGIEGRRGYFAFAGMNRAIARGAEARWKRAIIEIRKNLLKFDDVMNDQRKVMLRAAPSR